MSTARPLNGKVTLLDQLIFVETEVEDLETWKTVYQSEGSELPAGMAYRLRMCQQLSKTLELIKLHEREIVAIVKANRSNGRAAARPASTAISSARSMTPSDASEEIMEPSSEP